ncbi:GNAT family N-acetyltransferase [Nocardioides sp.]|uniref:GNAT family N-acetyltransferase n=1 Tax=Nocardioides sp. TaxID=35761 RepID=UPI00271F034D|nr:GNAT family N-acetyltransferase [Nocardioides sp.]MDO9456919.1 GNAT family N-acetyltransferase [Nocardioides sp.]
MQLRRATADDYEAVGRATVAAYEPFLLGPDDTYRERLADVAGRDRDAEVWVAVDDGDGCDGDGGQVLGNVTVCPVGSPWREISRVGEGEFRMLAVAPDAQGRGVGRALAEMVVDRFRSEGAHAVVLSSLDAMAGAHRLYERLGFVRLPARDWSPQPGVHLVAYALEL